MPSLSYCTTFGDQVKTIDIEQVSGSGQEGTWNVFIDRFYQGVVEYVDGNWIFREGPGCELQGEEIAGLLDLFTQKESG